MPISIEARVWLAAHLLYPNSTQAFDVYQAIVSQSDRAIRKQDAKHLLLKLYQICEKIPAVTSNLSFHVFENKPLTEWRIIYKKTQRIQQLIFIGVLIFDLSLEDVAAAFKMTVDKTRFLFHQTFKKVVQQSPQHKMHYEFQFKKSTDKQITYLYTHENLIDYSLGHLSKADSEKVRVGLQNFPMLQSSQTIYEGIIKQIKDLVEQHTSFGIEIPILTPTSEPTRSLNVGDSFKKVSQHKKTISISTISIVLLVFVFIRPRWIEHMVNPTIDEAVVLLELKKFKNADDEKESDTAQMNLNELPIQSAAKQKAAADNAKEQKEAAKLAAKTDGSPVKPIEKSPEKAEAKVAVAPQPPIPPKPVETKKQGGLYRGTLVVTDIEEVSPKVIEKIVSLGGKKAGEVELGWRKSEKLGYYHFTLPQDNVAAVNEFLGKFGHYKIDFENHPRLMPTGTKRFIIEVKEGD